MTKNFDMTQPRFRVEGKRKAARVILQCSKCGKDIRGIGMTEEIDVTRAYFCDEHDPGVVVPNVPDEDIGHA